MSTLCGAAGGRPFAGTSTPLVRRIPKRGFTNIFKKEYAILNINAFEALEGDSFDAARLMELGVIKKLGDGLKILGAGELKKKVHVKATLFSKAAIEKIQAAGGTAETIGA